MKKLSAVLAVLLLLSGCGANPMSSENATQSMPETAAAAPAAEAPEVYRMSPEEAGYAYDTAEAEAADGSGEAAPEVSGDKRIKRGEIFMEINNFDDTLSQIEAMVSENGGYTEQSSMGVYGQYDLKEANLTLRIPAENYDSVKDAICLLGRVTSNNESMEDVTGQYYDMEARLERKVLEEERLLAMIDEAAEIVDLIELEKRLSEVRTEIEIYRSRLNDMDSLVRYSTLNLNLTETTDEYIRPVADDLGSRMKDSFINSINFLISLLESLVVLAAGLIIPLAIIAVPVGIALFIFKRSRRK